MKKIFIFILLLIVVYIVGLFSGKLFFTEKYKNGLLVSGVVNNVNEKDHDFSDNINRDKKKLNAIMNGQKVLKIENKILISNIRKFISKNNRLFPQEVYYSVYLPVIHMLIDNKNSCKNLAKNINTFSKAIFLEQCNFVYYRKKILQNKGNFDVPKLMRDKNNFLRFVYEGKCDAIKNHSCLLLFNNISREKFKKDSLEFIRKNHIKKSDINISDYGFYIFVHKLNSLTTFEKIIDLFYDEALINKAIFNNDIGVCESILDISEKQYCLDLFNPNIKEKYKKMFDDFFNIIN